MLLGVSRDAKQSLHDQDNDDLQLLNGDVTIGIEDELPSIRFSEMAFHDLWDESQINVRDSDPVDPARLKGKGVAIYNNPLGREKKQVAKDLGLAGPSVRIESQWNQNQAVGGSPKTGSRSIKLNRHLMVASFNNSEPNSISPLANVNVINSRDILNQLSNENSSREIVPLMQGQPMSLWKRQNLNIPMRDMISVDPLPTYDEHFNILASLKIGDPKFLRRGSHTLRGKGSKFKVKASARESIAEAMTTIVDRIGLLCYFEVDVAAFLEAQVSGLKANRIITRIVLDCSHRIKARGFARSSWVCWKNNVQVQILLNDPQFIHCYLGKKLGSINFLVTFVYGYSDKQKCKALWDCLDQVTHFINEP
ncbi:hypothetical protein Goari_002658 [Gossypium aridum]|uniref:Uncharacterized protein n=1 Tax=Gossypium aridum TaxID=34290 RepID=A0A7J8Y8Z6_GOSAI|nr:hypothetical protein [Gossypium aridum]